MRINRRTPHPFEWWDEHLDREGRRTQAGGFVARCPSHADEKASLSVQQKNGRTLVNCLAGCKYDEIVAAASGEAPIETAPATSQNGRSHPMTWLAEYTGVSLATLRALPISEEGDFVSFDFERAGTAKQRRAGTKEFRWRGGSARPPIWPEPNGHMPGTLYLTEGETDALILRDRGIEAYSITKGANTDLPDAIWSALLKKGVEKVVLAFDQDEAGDKARKTYGAHALAAGLEVGDLDIPLDPFSGEKDLRDWALRTHGTEDLNLRSMQMGQLLSGLELQDNIPWICFPYLVRGAVTMLAGPPKAGKTTFLYAMLEATQHGWEFLSDQAVKGLPKAQAFMLTEETGYTLRQKADVFNVDPKVLTFDMAEAAWDFPLLVSNAAKMCRDEGRQILVIDTLSVWARYEDENSATEVTQVLAMLRQVAQQYNLAVLFIHHTNKGDANFGREARGSGAMLALVDIYILFTYKSRDERSVTVQSRFLGHPEPITVTQDRETFRIDKITQEESQAMKDAPILDAIAAAGGAATRKQLMDATGLGDTQMRDLLRDLKVRGKVVEAGFSEDGKTILYGAAAMGTWGGGGMVVDDGAAAGGHTTYGSPPDGTATSSSSTKARAARRLR